MSKLGEFNFKKCVNKYANQWLFSGCALLFSGFVCAAPVQQNELSNLVSAPNASKSIEEKTQAVYRLLLAETAVGLGLSDLAQPLFLVLAQDWNDAYLLERGTDAALSAQDYNDTYRLAERWVELDPASSRAREMKGIAAWLTDKPTTELLLKDALLKSQEQEGLMNQWIKGMSKLAAGEKGVKKSSLDTLDSRYELLSRVAQALTQQPLQKADSKNTSKNTKTKTKTITNTNTRKAKQSDIKNTKATKEAMKPVLTSEAIEASGKVQLSLAVFAFQLQRFEDAQQHALQAWQQSKHNDVLAKDIGTLLSKDAQAQEAFWVDYLKSSQNSVLARCMLGLSKVDARDRLEAYRLLTPVAGLLEGLLSDDSPESQETQQALGTLPTFTLAVYLSLQNRHQAARAYFNEYLSAIEKQNKKDPAVIERIVFAKLGLLRGFLVQKNASAAADLFKELSELKPEMAKQASIEKLKLLALTQGIVPALKQIKQWEAPADQASSGVVPNNSLINNTTARRMTLDLYHYLDATDMAVETINYWLDQGNNQVEDEVLLTRELAYFKDKQLKSSQALDLLNQLQGQYPDNEDIWNDLAYLLVNHSLDLNRAAKLTNKAYKADSGNPAIIDTLGWLIYRQGDKKLALEKIQLSYDLMFDAEVAVHLYELLLANQQTFKAQRVFDELAAERPDQLYRLEAIDLQTKTTQQIKSSKKMQTKSRKPSKLKK